MVGQGGAGEAGAEAEGEAGEGQGQHQPRGQRTQVRANWPGRDHLTRFDTFFQKQNCSPYSNRMCTLHIMIYHVQCEQKVPSIFSFIKLCSILFAEIAFASGSGSM